MSRERSILERLAKPRTKGQRTLTENTTEITRSVLLNLQHILNSRLGDAPAQPDLGMPSPSEITQASPDAINLVMRNLRSCIEKYEPRLTAVEIAHVEAGDEILTLRFQVTARLTISRDGATISFDTVVDPGGRIRLHN
ncbi:MAG TPA: type VI secretion system baseplate subunit TssE [Planctomycetota bacterium]|jgi:type VI secretion system protein|nr:type VI secretion system baseplate subunit TssE [Planctomycetota bacterium]